MTLTKEMLFVDDLDGRWTLGINYGEEGTMTLCAFNDESDVWLYPEELGYENIVNVWFDDDNWNIEVYDLPENWREIVTHNRGKDGKPSIHDIMESQS